jgi:hypothetical protein
MPILKRMGGASYGQRPVTPGVPDTGFGGAGLSKRAPGMNAPAQAPQGTQPRVPPPSPMPMATATLDAETGPVTPQSIEALTGEGAGMGATGTGAAGAPLPPDAGISEILKLILRGGR